MHASIKRAPAMAAQSITVLHDRRHSVARLGYRTSSVGGAPWRAPSPAGIRALEATSPLSGIGEIPTLSSAMQHKSSFPFLLCFTVLSFLYLRAQALPALGTYSAMRMGNRIPYDGANEPDQSAASLKAEADILQSSLPENDKLYLDMSRAIDRNSRHADGLFTSGYSKLLGQLSARRYLESLIGKRVSNNALEEELPPVKRHSDAIFTDNYSRFRKQMAVKKYLDSVLTGKRSMEEINPATLRDEADLSDPTFSEKYDGVTVDELLNHLPLNL